MSGQGTAKTSQDKPRQSQGKSRQVKASQGKPRQARTNQVNTEGNVMAFGYDKVTQKTKKEFPM
jgi:hypothetical protein